MPIRRVKQYSDRGSIKNLSKDAEPELPPEPFELRMKEMYEFAVLNKDKQLQAQTGFITTDYIGDKTVLPLSAYRIRQVVADIKAREPGIEQFTEELGQCITFETEPAARAYWDRKNALTKTASKRKAPVFRRVSRS